MSQPQNKRRKKIAILIIPFVVSAQFERLMHSPTRFS